MIPPRIDGAADRGILRGLAGEVAELASRPVEDEKRRLWTTHNRLGATRPLVFCDPENGWREILPESVLACEGELAREWEMSLRKEIAWAEFLADDRVIEPFFPVHWIHEESDWGLAPAKLGGHDGGAFIYDPPLKDWSGLELLRPPVISVDRPGTRALLELAAEVFGDLLPPRLRGITVWSVGLTATLIALRGLENFMTDLIDYPGEIHRLMSILRDGTAAKLDFLEREGLLGLNNDGSYVGTGGFGWSDELPAPGYDGGHARLRDLWGSADSQETVGVSPAMFEEFVLPYQLPLLDRFGLNCYGCCEPLDPRWAQVSRVPRLRRASVSPWASVPKMAEYLGDRYVFSMKPSPTPLAMPILDEEELRAGLRSNLAAARDCRVEIVMKDNHSLGGHPGNARAWVAIAREESGRSA